jgi:hypothetical protein
MADTFFRKRMTPFFDTGYALFSIISYFLEVINDIRSADNGENAFPVASGRQEDKRRHQ